MAKSPRVETTAFAEQPRAVLQGSEKAPAPNAVHVKSTPPRSSVTVSVIVRRKEPLKFVEIGGVTHGPARVTRSEFKKRHAADPADLKLVKAFAKEFKLSVEEDPTAAARRTLKLTGAAADMQKAFGVELSQKTINGVEYRVRDGGIHIPAALAGVVVAVLGLDNRPQAKPHFRVRGPVRTAAAAAKTATARPEAAAPEAAAPSSFTPPQVAQAYQFPSTASGAGETIAIIELGGGYRQADLTAYFQTLGLAAPPITAVSVDKGKNAPSTASSADGEVMLDIEVAASVAPGANIAVYFTPNTDQGFTDAITTAIHDTANKPSVISISWGGPESSWTAQAMTALDAACQSAAALGVTITVAAGDNGSTDGGTGNNVDFPASSPHVLACGGTKLNANGSTVVSEVVWNELSSNEGATGGGVSNVFPLPSWQADSKVPAPTNSAGGRGVPDVAGDADPASGYTIRVDGETMVIGGTSAVAPLWAGLIAVANQQLGAQVGFIQPAIYAASAAVAFNDITEGNNGAFSAGPGWDACTGLGSPLASKLIPLLVPSATPPAPPAKKKKKKKKKESKVSTAGSKAGKSAAGKKPGKKTQVKKAGKKKKKEKKQEKKKTKKKK